MSAPKKYWRELLRHLPDGYKIDYQRVPAKDRQAARRLGKHPVVYTPDGTILRAHNGQPVTVSGTPGTLYSLKADLNGIRRAGVPVR
jgi:hypothetical protein